MKIVLAIFAVLAFIVAAFVAYDMARFARAKKRAEKPTAAKADAGGYLFHRGGKTYYKMPNGTDRKIADTTLDLRPGSPDMIRFTELMELAAKEHETDKLKSMRDAAKEITQDV